MDLSIILLTHNTKNLVRECIKNIKHAAPRLRYEIIVVDNASGDGTVAALRDEFPDIQVIASPTNTGFGVGNNLGLQQAHGRYACIFNPDITVLPGSLEKLYAYMEAHPRVGLAGPKLMNADRSLQYSCFRFPSVMMPIYRRTPLGGFGFARRAVELFLMKEYDHALPRTVDWLMGGALIARMSAVHEVGLLDSRYFLYYEDMDWARTFWACGWEVHYVADAAMIHLHQRDSAQGNLLKSMLRRSTRIHIRAAIKYYAKWGLIAKT